MLNVNICCLYVRVYTKPQLQLDRSDDACCAVMKATLLQHVGCLACRIGLAYSIGDILTRRVELNTPLHSLISIKEGLFWKDTGRSPYTGSFFRGAPLVLPLFRLTSQHVVWQAIALSVVDWITARVLSSVAAVIGRQSGIGRPGTLYTYGCAQQLCMTSAIYYYRFAFLACAVAEHTAVQESAPLLYLVNPCLVLSTAAGSTANLANLSVVTALHGGLTGNPALAGLGLAAGSYLSAHPVLLLVCHILLAI